MLKAKVEWLEVRLGLRVTKRLKRLLLLLVVVVVVVLEKYKMD